MDQNFYIKENKFGKGVYANRLIKKGETIFKFEGPIISRQEAIDKGDRQGDPLQISKTQYIDTKDPARLVNHSCDPNSGIKNDETLIALNNIEKDEEISFDYSTTIEENLWTMQCRCDSKNCRKVVGDFSKLPKDVQKKYLEQDVVMSFIKEELAVKK